MSQTDTSEAQINITHTGNGKVVEQAVPSIMTMMAQASTSGNIEVLERLTTLWERTKDRDREIAAKQAFVRMHHDIPQIEKKGRVDTVTKRGGTIKYGFATQEDIDEVVRPIMTKHGFGLTFRPIEQTADYIIVEGELIHEDTGWSFTARKQEPIDKDAYMGIQQKGGAAQTFAIRYLTVALLNIVVKGEDTDGTHRERGPASPPPSEKSMGNVWAKSVEDILKRNPQWWGALAHGFADAKTSEDLEALVDLVRDNVNTLDAGKQKEIGEALMKARERLSAAPERFDFLVRDAEGETDGELYPDVAGWVREFKEYWNAATGAEARENLLHHNADALVAARKTRTPLLKDVDEWRKETSGDESPPLSFETVQPPMNNGRPVWSAWVKSLIGNFPEDEYLMSWLEAQKSVMADAEILYRQVAVRVIAGAMTKRGMAKPDWLRQLILPIGAACDHKEWAEARMAELHWITDTEGFEAAKNAAYPRMRVMNKEDKPTFDIVAAAFGKKQGELG